MECSGFTSGFSNRHAPYILFTGLQGISGRPPISLGNLRKGPGMALPAGEITPRLVDGKIVFWAGEINSGNKPEEAIVGLLQGGFAGEGFPSFDGC